MVEKHLNLSKNQKIIFDLIDKSPEPMKAYSILFNVQKKWIKASSLYSPTYAVCSTLLHSAHDFKVLTQ